MRLARRTAFAALLTLATAAGASSAPAQERATPSAVNPGVRNFDDPNLVYAGGPEARNSPLVVFMPGTGGRSENAPDMLLETILQQGYKVVYLTYDDEPAVNQICPERPPACSARFRNSRAFGGDGPPVATSEPEAIVQRLADLLGHLDRARPDQGWGAYLDPTGRPAWPRIVLSGLSQGAGMAAFLAKRFPVERVVLFSSPWDFTGPDRQPAPWLYDRSATPPERWWAERHVRENTTVQIAHAYAALAIPGDHILLFDGGLPDGASPQGGNPYHTSTIRLPQYVPQWRILYGQPAAAVGRSSGAVVPNPASVAASVPPAAPSGGPPGVEQFVGTWRVVGVAVAADGVQALSEDDPAYMRREVLMTPRKIAWKGGSAPGATTDDVCVDPTLQAAASTGQGHDGKRYAALLRRLAIMPREVYAVHCGFGTWGPAAAGGIAIDQASSDTIALPWYDGAVLKLRRER